MKIVRFPLSPMSHFHFGEIAQDEESNLSTTSSYPHSDTLFSSLVNCYAQAHGIDEVNLFISDFNDRATKISSMFFALIINNSPIYFLPKPLLYSTKVINRKYYKHFKKIEFITFSVLESVSDPNDFFDINRCSILQEKFVVLKDEINEDVSGKIQIYSKMTQPKVPIRVANENDSIYFETDVEIADNSKISESIEINYYFMYDSDQEERLKDAIELMSLGGIGGGRSTGAGVLGKPVFESRILKVYSDNNVEKYCCISMSLPNDLDEFKKFKLYETMIRGGRRMDSGEQMFVRMIKEGAVLSSKVYGKLVKIGTDDYGNTVLRNGLCFLIPLKIE